MKWSKCIIFVNTKVKKNMTTTLKYNYAVLFLFLFLIAKEADGKLFLSFLNSLLSFYSFYIFFPFHFNNITSFSFFFTAQIICKTDDDCPKIPHLFPSIYRCIYNKCIIGTLIPKKIITKRALCYIPYMNWIIWCW